MVSQNCLMRGKLIHLTSDVKDAIAEMEEERRYTGVLFSSDQYNRRALTFVHLTVFKALIKSSEERIGKPTAG